MTARIFACGRYAPGGAFVAQALEAETLAEATATDELVPIESVYGDRLRFLEVWFSDSDLDGTLPFFAIVDAINLATGEPIKTSCGGTRVVATLVRAVEKGWFPFDASVVPIDVGNGKKALNLVPAPKQV